MIVFLLCVVIAVLVFGASALLGVLGWILSGAVFLGVCLYFDMNPILALADGLVGLATIILAIRFIPTAADKDFEEFNKMMTIENARTQALLDEQATLNKEFIKDSR